MSIICGMLKKESFSISFSVLSYLLGLLFCFCCLKFWSLSLTETYLFCFHFVYFLTLTVIDDLFLVLLFVHLYFLFLFHQTIWIYFNGHFTYLFQLFCFLWYSWRFFWFPICFCRALKHWFLREEVLVWEEITLKFFSGLAFSIFW